MGLPSQVARVRLSSGNYGLPSSEDVSTPVSLFLNSGLEVVIQLSPSSPAIVNTFQW